MFVCVFNYINSASNLVLFDQYWVTFDGAVCHDV